MKLMLDDEAAVLDPPQPLPGTQGRQQGLLGAGQPECGGCAAKLVGLLPIDHEGLGICQERRCEGTHGGALVSDVVEVGFRVDVVAEVPPLGLWGPAVRLSVVGHAVEEVAP